MINLAGNKNCDLEIERELRRARLVLIRGEVSNHEVASRLTATLGPLTFWRAWRYWVVSGPVPLSVARELYADPIGVTDVRVNGHCGCPAPESPWARHVDANGKRLSRLDGPDAPSRREVNPSPLMAEMYARIDATCEFVEDPASVAVASFVDTYHIDSEAGLRLFVDTVRRHFEAKEYQ